MNLSAASLNFKFNIVYDLILGPCTSISFFNVLELLGMKV